MLKITISHAEDYHGRVDPDRLWKIDSNGPHGLYASEYYRKSMISFMDHFVKGEDNGFEETPHLQIWQETQTDIKSEFPTEARRRGQIG